jgi:hypothetical protein
VDRVKWFRDRSARDRAREEKEILEEELGRTVRYFQHMQKTWTTLASKKQDTPGYSAYAHKQCAMYERFAIDTEVLQVKAKEKCDVYVDWQVPHTVIELTL